MSPWQDFEEQKVLDFWSLRVLKWSLVKSLKGFYSPELLPNTKEYILIILMHISDVLDVVCLFKQQHPGAKVTL